VHRKKTSLRESHKSVVESIRTFMIILSIVISLQPVFASEVNRNAYSDRSSYPAGHVTLVHESFDCLCNLHCTLHNI